MTPNPSVSSKNPSGRKLLHQFTETLYVNNKTAFCGLDSAKENCKAIKKINVLWSKITKHCGHTKIS